MDLSLIHILMGTFPVAFVNPLPSLHPLDLLIGFSCGAGLRLAVYLRSKNAKKYRHGMESVSYTHLGQTKALDYVEDLVLTGCYKKAAAHGVAAKEA